MKAVTYLLTANATLTRNHSGQDVFDILIEEKNQDVAMAIVMHDR